MVHPWSIFYDVQMIEDELCTVPNHKFQKLTLWINPDIQRMPKPFKPLPLPEYGAAYRRGKEDYYTADRGRFARRPASSKGAQRCRVILGTTVGTHRYPQL